MLSLNLENVKYSDDSCSLDLKLSFDKEYDLNIKLFPLDKNWFLGSNTWDIVGNMVISIKGDGQLNCNYGNWKQKFDFFFAGMMSELPYFKGLVDDYIQNYAKKWKDTYFETFYRYTFLNEDSFDKIKWTYDFKEPISSILEKETTGVGKITIEFSKSKIRDILNFKKFDSNNLHDFAQYLMEYIYGDLKIEIGVPPMIPSLFTYIEKNMEKGDFLAHIQQQLSNDSQSLILNELGNYLIERFWDEKIELPKDTLAALENLNATDKKE